MIFHRGLLALVSGLVAFLIAAAAMNPPAGRAGVSSTAGTSLTAPSFDGEADSGLRPASGPLTPNSVAYLTRTFNRADFDLDHVADGKGVVPRLYIKRFPHDLSDVAEVKDRKAVFFRTLLPLVLKVNEDLRAERRRLWSQHSRLRLGEKPGAVDRLWLIVMAERYKVRRGDVDALLARVDVVPPSLALAQAAEESGWGTSRFAKEGNALFGQWTWTGKGIAPLSRDEGKTHKIRAFSSLLESVRAYTLNLNTHRAYRNLRAARADMRATGNAFDGHALAGYLDRYSERGLSYVDALRTIMNANRLDRFDEAKLASL